MAFTAQDVKNLREKTGVGMMECKKALTEADGDMDRAFEILRERGLAASEKKASRIAAEGAIIAYTDEATKTTVLLEINSETDFVGKNDKFQAFGLNVAKTIAANKPASVEDLSGLALVDSDRTVQEALNDLILVIGENLKIRRYEIVEGDVVTYIHGGGAVGVAVKFETNLEDKAEFVAMGKNIAMQVAAMNPSYLDAASVPAEVVEKEKAINLAQMNEDPKMANKPEQVKEKIIEGKIKKFYTEVCLLDQTFVRSDLFEGSVSGYVANVAKAIGADIKGTGYVRLAKGEGIEKKADDFAAEVASMMNN
jgi:elongation factor Ts